VVRMWQSEQALKCAQCGTFEWEWEEDSGAWTADIFWCLGCKQLEELRTQTAHDALHTEGYKVRLYRGGDVDGD